jgi:hypothetical protein
MPSKTVISTTTEAMGENERCFYEGKYDLFMQRVLPSTYVADYEKRSTQEKDDALQEVEALLQRLSVEQRDEAEENLKKSLKESSSLDENPSTAEEPLIQTQPKATSQMNSANSSPSKCDSNGRLDKSETDSLNHREEKKRNSSSALLATDRTSGGDSSDSENEQDVTTASLDLLASAAQEEESDSDNSEEDLDVTALSMDLLAGASANDENDNGSCCDSVATPDLVIGGGGECSPVELGRRTTCHTMSPQHVKSLSYFDNEKTPDLSKAHSKRRGGKRLASTSGKKGTDMHRLRLDDEDGCTESRKLSCPAEDSPFFSQHYAGRAKGDNALSQLMGSQSPITPCLDDVVMIDAHRRSVAEEDEEAQHQSPAEASVPRRAIRFDDVLSPPTPPPQEGEESDFDLEFNDYRHDKTHDEEIRSHGEGPLNSSPATSRDVIQMPKSRVRNIQDFHRKNLIISQSRFGSTRQQESGAMGMPLNDTIEDTERTLILDRRRKLRLATSQRLGSNNILSTHNGSVLLEAGADAENQSPDLGEKPRVRLKEGACVRMVPLAIAQGRKPKLNRTDSRRRVPLGGRQNNAPMDQPIVLSLPDPVESIFSGRMSERLDAVVDWLSPKINTDIDSPADNFGGKGVVLSLEEKQIRSVVVKLLRRELLSHQSSVSSIQGGALLVLREKDESMEAWECFLREKSSFSVLSHARLSSTARKRLPFSRLAGYDVVLTTYDALKAKEKIYTMDAHLDQPVIGGGNLGGRDSEDQSKGWFSGTSGSDSQRRQSKELSMLHGVQWTTVVYVDVLGRGSYTSKATTARAITAKALLSQSK